MMKPENVQEAAVLMQARELLPSLREKCAVDPDEPDGEPEFLEMQYVHGQGDCPQPEWPDLHLPLDLAEPVLNFVEELLQARLRKLGVDV